MPIRRLVLALAVAACVTAVVVPQAMAASAETTPVVVGALDVQLWPGAVEGQGIAILAVSVPETTTLPARVHIPIPAGTTVDWVGEIGDEVTEDVERPHTIEQGPDGTYAAVDLVGSRIAQLEVSGLPLENEDGTYSVKLDFVQTAPASVTGFSVRLPAGASDISIKPTAATEPETNDAGETLYTLESATLKDGESRTITASYRLGGAADDGGSALSTNTLLGVLIGVLLLLGLVLVVVLRRQRPAGD